VPQIEFTETERTLIDAVLVELDPSTHELTRDFKDDLSEDDWRFLVRYARREMRACLELGLLARSAADTARLRNLSNDEGAFAFLRSVSWLRNFGITDPEDERFLGLAGEGPEAPMFLAVDALIEIAKDRIFDTVGDEYRQLLYDARP
jgi:hypothetical protein